MRLLAIAAQYPFPPRMGGAIVVFNQLKELSERHSIYFICTDIERERVESSKYIDQIEVISRKKALRFIGWPRMIFGSAPAVVGARSKKMCARVREIVARENFDAVLLYELNAIQYCPPSYYRRAIVNVEDPQSIKLERMGKLSVWSLVERIRLSAHAVFTRRYETRILSKLGRVLALSEADIRDMQSEGGYENLGYVTYGVDEKPDTEILDWESRTEGMIVFSGNMFHRPNVDGILFFLSCVFPFVLKDQPSATVWIVGAEPDPRIHEAAARFGDQVIITGTVDDVSKYVRRAKVSICPIRLKIGVQTKILEALSWATPVVTTSAGNSGIGGISGSELWVEDQPEEFALRVISLLRGERWNQLSEKGRKFAAEHFTWKRSVVQLEHYIDLIWAAN